MESQKEKRKRGREGEQRETKAKALLVANDDVNDKHHERVQFTLFITIHIIVKLNAAVFSSAPKNQIVFSI